MKKKQTLVYEVLVEKVGRDLYRLVGCSSDRAYERLSVNPTYDETICSDIGWCLNKFCDMVRVSDHRYVVRCYEL